MYCDWPQLGRCCFCMPLRRGVLTFGYIHIFFSAFMIGMYSYAVNYGIHAEWLINARGLFYPAEICLAFFCIELIFDAILIYGAHKKTVKYLKAYYYYNVTTAVAMVVMQILDVVKRDSRFMYNAMETCILSLAGLCLQIYLLTLVWSLIKKLEISGPHVYDNQLHQIVNGELKVEPNGIYNNPTVVPAVV